MNILGFNRLFEFNMGTLCLGKIKIQVWYCGIKCSDDNNKLVVIYVQLSKENNNKHNDTIYI